MEHNTTSPDAIECYNRGVYHTQEGNWEQAIEEYTQALNLEPEFTQACYQRGNAFLRLGQLEAAIDDYTCVIEMDIQGPAEQKAPAYHNRARAYALQGALGKASDDYTQAVLLFSDPGCRAVAFCNRGLTHFRIGNPEQAIQDYNQAIAINPDYTDAFYNRALAYAALEEIERAIEDYNRVLALEPGDYDALLQRGILNIELDRLQNAILDFQQAAQYQPERVEAAYELARALAAQGLAEPAIKALKHAVALDKLYITLAIQEPAFEAIRQLPEFESLVRT